MPAEVERDEEILDGPRPSREERPRPEPKKEKPVKPKKKKGRGCGLLLLAVLALAGALAGLQAVGTVDLRPLLYEAVPRIPQGGTDLADLFGIPAVYSLTPEERRSQELEERNRRLSAEALSLDRARRDLQVLSVDLTRQDEEARRLTEELARKLAELQSRDSPSASADLETNLDRLLGTFEEMSPRSAAQIVARMNNELATALLSRLPEDRVAQILGRMDADRAAALTEQLSTMQQRR